MHRPALGRPSTSTTARFSAGLCAGAVVMLLIWRLEPVPDPYRAFAHVAPSPLACFAPPLLAVAAAIGLGGRGVAGVLVGAALGVQIAVWLFAPVYIPHVWDELDGARHSWFIWAGVSTLLVTWAVGISAWAIHRVVPAASRRRRAGPLAR